MEIEYDPAKNATNIEKHGIDFEDIQMFDFDSATIRIDTRSDYGETRFFAYGYTNDFISKATRSKSYSH